MNTIENIKDALTALDKIQAISKGIDDYRAIYLETTEDHGDDLQSNVVFSAIIFHLQAVDSLIDRYKKERDRSQVSYEESLQKMKDSGEIDEDGMIL